MVRQELWRETRMALTAKALICAGLWMFGGGRSPAVAADRETREFTVRVDGKPAGSYQMTISRPDDRTFIMEGRAHVSVSYLLIKYKYAYNGTEVWKDGRLVHLKSTTDDGGKRFEVLAQADEDSLRVRVNSSARTSRPDVWTTTYWRLPDPKFRNQPVALLDCDTGKEINGFLQHVAAQQITVAGQTQNCAHYRITGGVQVEVWYDAQQRLVRQEFMEDGHRTVLELVRLVRSP